MENLKREYNSKTNQEYNFNTYHHHRQIDQPAEYVSNNIGIQSSNGTGMGKLRIIKPLTYYSAGYLATQDNQNANYYQEYCKLFVANVVLTNQIKELISEKNELLAKVAKLEVTMPEDRQASAQLSAKKTDENSLSKQSSQDEFQERKKRVRRTAAEIEKCFSCPAENCEKAYGSEGALIQHVRLKHPEMLEAFKVKLAK